MPGGRPQKYADKAAAKAADRLRAMERKAAAKRAGGEGHGVRVKADGDSHNSYQFILEDVVCVFICLRYIVYRQYCNLKLSYDCFNISSQEQWTATRQPPRAAASRSLSPWEGPSLSRLPSRVSSPDVNRPDVPGLDACERLTLESTAEAVSHNIHLDFDGLRKEDLTRNTENIASNDSDDNYRQSLNDVLIDFGGDFDTDSIVGQAR